MYRSEKVIEKVAFDLDGSNPSFEEVVEGDDLDGVRWVCMSRKHYFLGIHVGTSRDYLLEIEESEDDGVD